ALISSAAVSRRSRAEHFALLRATPRGGLGGKRNGSPQLNSGRDYFGLIRNSARRFLAQQASTCSEHSGRSSPKLTREIRSAAIPWETRESRAARARRSPRARLYPAVPRSSAWPALG